MKDRNREGRSEPKRNEGMNREGFRGSSMNRKDKKTGDELRRERNQTERDRNPNRNVESE